MSEWKQYRRTNVAEMRPYIHGELLECISVSDVDDPPNDMGMVARNPQNHSDQWYVARKYFEDNFAELERGAEPVSAKFIKAVKDLVIAARTTGGIAGPDEHLKLCLEDVEELLTAHDQARQETEDNPELLDAYQALQEDYAILARKLKELEESDPRKPVLIKESEVSEDEWELYFTWYNYPSRPRTFFEQLAWQDRVLMCHKIEKLEKKLDLKKLALKVYKKEAAPASRQEVSLLRRISGDYRRRSDLLTTPDDPYAGLWDADESDSILKLAEKLEAMLL